MTEIEARAAASTAEADQAIQDAESRARLAAASCPVDLYLTDP